MKKMLGAIACTVMLVGCGPASVEDLIENPEKLAEVAQECAMKMAQGKDANTQECKNAAQATRQMSSNMMQGLGG